MNNLQVISIVLPSVTPKKGAFHTTNKSGTKQGLFSFPNHAFQYDEEEIISQNMFKKISFVSELLPDNVGKNYNNQVDSLRDGIAGIIHWYIGQYLKSDAFITNSTGNSIALKAIYNVNNRSLFLSSFLRILTRHTGHPQYTILGKIIDTYIDWNTYKKNNDWLNAEKMATYLFGMGHSMSKAEYEHPIIAGKARVSELNRQKTQERNIKKQEAIDLLPEVIKRIKSERPSLQKIPKTQVYQKIANEISMSKEAVKRYLKGIDFKQYE